MGEKISDFFESASFEKKSSHQDFLRDKKNRTAREFIKEQIEKKKKSFSFHFLQTFFSMDDFEGEKSNLG